MLTDCFEGEKQIDPLGMSPRTMLILRFALPSRAGIPAVNKNGDLLLLYVGIIDILQNYRLRKKLEHAFKSTLVTRVCLTLCIGHDPREACVFVHRRKYPFVIQAIMVIVSSDFFHIKYFVKVS